MNRRNVRHVTLRGGCRDRRNGFRRGDEACAAEAGLAPSPAAIRLTTHGQHDRMHDRMHAELANGAVTLAT
jgi:hypothetical protein